MRVRNSRERDGFIAAQDHREPKSGQFYSGGVVSLDVRAGEYCVRIVGRGELGHFEHEKKLAGDMLGTFVWQQKGLDRPIPAWQQVRGSVVAGDPGGPTTGPTPQPVATAGGSLGMVGLPVSPVAAPPRATEVLPQGGKKLAQDDRFLAWSFPYQGATNGAPSSPGGSVGTRLDGEEGTLPASWPAFPIGTTGLMVQTTDELKQIMAWHPTDPRLVAPNRGGSPAHGTIVSDLTSRGGYDESVTAPLQSIFNVVLRPRDGYGMKNNAANVVGLQIGRSGLRDTPGTVFVDGDAGRVKVLGRPSVRDGGPLDCVRGGCKHTTGTDGDGNPISPVHLSDKSLFRTGLRAPVTNKLLHLANSFNGVAGVLPPHLANGTSNTTPGGVFDGPLDFETPWPNPVIEGPYTVLCHIGYDPAKTYRISRDGQENAHAGMWRIWTGIYIGTNDTPGKGPITPSEPREPRDPPPPPPPGGPSTPGGDNTTTPETPGGDIPPMGGGVGSPGGDNSGSPPTPPDGGIPSPGTGGPGGTGGGTPPASPPGGGGGTPTPGGSVPTDGLPTDELDRIHREQDAFYDRLLEELRRKKRTQDQEQTSTIGAGTSSLLVPRVSGVTTLEHVFPSIVGRPQAMTLGVPDMRFRTRTKPGEVDAVETSSPQVIRTEAFGKQSGATFVHTQQPGKSRSLSGTGSGGTIDLVPEHDMTDVAFNSAYGDAASMTGASSSSRIVGYGVTLAWGKPSVTTGLPTESVGATADYTNKSVKFRYYDTNGNPIEIVEIENGLVQLADQVNIGANTGTGNSFGTSASEKVGMHGSASQQSTGWGTAGVSGVKSLTVASTLNDVLDYLGELESALKDKGIIGT